MNSSMTQLDAKKPLFVGAIAIAIAAAFAAVFLNASESSLVALSYLIVPLLVFGLAGLTLTKGSLKGALACAGVALLLLFSFLVIVFPML